MTNSLYAWNVAYAAQGAVSGLSLGNTLSESWGFNARQQPTGLTATLGTTQLLNLGWGYANSPAMNNGDVMSATIQRSSGLSGTVNQIFSYLDQANRLSGASETSSWSQSYLYDAYGNRAVSSASWMPSATFTPTLPTQFVNNQWQLGGSEVGYDAAGNQTGLSIPIGSASDNALMNGTYAYDGENRLLVATMNSGPPASFVYDGEGRRVQKIVGSGGSAVTTTYVHDASGNLAAEYGGTGVTPGKNFLTDDMLGSTRLVTDGSGNVLRCIDYLPFGEEIPAGPTTGRSGCYGTGDYPSSPDVTSLKFTGKERDAETGLDYFGARYFSGAQGRFTSPDPMMASAKVSNPQSWNRYAYGFNNPLRFTDPTGMYTCEGTKGQCKDFEKTRLKVLGSDNSAAKRAASAYGTATDNNGVVVRFADKLANDRGGTVGRDAPSGIRLDPNDPSQTHVQASLLVTIQSDNISNEETIAHEGSHVADYQAFVNTLSAQNPYGDQSLDITHLASETSAYGLSVAYTLAGNGRLNYGPCGGVDQQCKFSPAMMPAQRDQLIHDLITDPRNKYTGLNTVLYPELLKPQQK
jgi:RHS repeat-associated protein